MTARDRTGWRPSRTPARAAASVLRVTVRWPGVVPRASSRSMVQGELVLAVTS